MSQSTLSRAARHAANLLCEFAHDNNMATAVIRDLRRETLFAALNLLDSLGPALRDTRLQLAEAQGQGLECPSCGYASNRIEEVACPNDGARLAVVTWKDRAMSAAALVPALRAEVARLTAILDPTGHDGPCGPLYQTLTVWNQTLGTDNARLTAEVARLEQELHAWRENATKANNMVDALRVDVGWLEKRLATVETAMNMLACEHNSALYPVTGPAKCSGCGFEWELKGDQLYSQRFALREVARKARKALAGGRRLPATPEPLACGYQTSASSNQATPATPPAPFTRAEVERHIKNFNRLIEDLALGGYSVEVDVLVEAGEVLNAYAATLKD